MEAASIDEAKAFLYGQPVASFVAERDVLAKAIRARGDRALANEVKALRKPSAVAAAVNHVVRADPDGVELILQAAELLRSAQAGALDGTTVNTAELQAQYRAAIQALAQSAPNRRVEVRAALEAATIDEASNEDLRTGCLVAVPTPVSIFGTAAPAPATDKSAAAKSTDELEERRAKRRANEAAAKDAAAKHAAAKDAAAKDAEQERQKALQKKRKDVQKRHRAALVAHAAALAEEEAAADAVSSAEQELVAFDDEIESAERALAELRLRREQMAAERDRCEQARTEANQRAGEAQAAVEALAETLVTLTDTQP